MVLPFSPGPGLVIKHGKFSKTEDEQIRAAVEVFRETHDLSAEELSAVIHPTSSADRRTAFWISVTSAVPARTMAAVFSHVKRMYDSINFAQPWTAEEDARLVVSVLEHGRNWVKAGAALGRMAAACRDRYRNHIEGAADALEGKWSEEEVEQLIAAYDKVGRAKDGSHNWNAVVKQMGGTRTRHQIRIKWYAQSWPSLGLWLWTEH